MNSVLIKTKGRQNLLAIFVLLLLTILMFLPLLLNSFWSSMMNSHSMIDLEHHLALIRSLNDGWHNGHFASGINSLINQDFGYANGIFYSIFPAAITVIFMNVFFMPVNAALFLEIVLLFWIAGVLCYFFAKRVFNNNVTAFIAAACFILFPHNWSGIYFRFALAEMFMIIPIVLVTWSLYELFFRDNYKTFMPLFIIGLSAAVLFHQITAVYLIIYAGIFCLLNYKKLFKKYYFCPLLAGGIAALLISAFYIIPVLSNLDYVSLSLINLSRKIFLQNINMDRFDFIYTELISILVLYVYSNYLYGKKDKGIKCTKAEKQLLFYGIIGVIIATPIFPWWAVPEMFFFIQFALRLLIFNSIITALQIGIIISNVKYLTNNKIMYNGMKYTGYACLLICAVILPQYFFIVKQNKNNLCDVNTIADNETEFIENIGTGGGLGVYMNLSPLYTGTDYYPKTGNKKYTYERANEKMVVATSAPDEIEFPQTPGIYNLNGSFIREFANYQSLNCIQFLVAGNYIGVTENEYAVLNIPYKFCSDIKVYQFQSFLDGKDITKENAIEEIKVDGYNYSLLKLNFAETYIYSKVVIKYPDGSDLQKYLREYPFEFIALTETVPPPKFTAANFIKTGLNYTVEFDLTERMTIELPTFYYKGYEIKYTNDSGESYFVNGVMGRNGFYEVTLNESGTLSVQYTGGSYMLWRNIVFSLGIAAFILLLFVIHKTPQEFWTNAANKINGFFKPKKTH